MADSYAKWAAEAPYDPVGRAYRQEASLGHSRKVTGVRFRRTREWIRDHVRSSRRYGPPGTAGSVENYKRKGGRWPAGISSSSPDTRRLDLTSRGLKDRDGQMLVVWQ